MTEMSPEETLEENPRQQHYLFVHRYLRDKCLQSPLGALEDYYFDENATKHLKLSWATLGFGFRAEGESLIHHEGIEAIPVEVNERYKCAIFVFPKPERITEAFMSAIIVPFDHPEDTKPKSRYITLEYNPARPGGTYIGEWTGGMHLNCGAGPDPTVEDFSSYLKSVIERSEKRSSSESNTSSIFDDLFSGLNTELDHKQDGN